MPDERGIALVMALIVGILVSITVAVVLNIASYRLHTSSSQQRRGASFYASEAGIQMAFVKLRAPGITPFNNQGLAQWAQNVVRSETITVGTQSVRVDVRRTNAVDPPTFKVTATAS